MVRDSTQPCELTKWAIEKRDREKSREVKSTDVEPRMRRNDNRLPGCASVYEEGG